ncbi:MAG TPA: CocE/NonD family hydrolase [Gemmatimonadaceae bacterium]|nr:CocE/NonD family hydrolase [Gemmatimonadaceae bacterium]
MRSLFRAALMAALCSFAAASLPAQAPEVPDSTFVRANYTKHEYYVPMRDGVRLFTAVYVPNDASPSRTYPIVIQRTPFSVAPYGPDAYAAAIAPDRFMMRDKYIVVYQDVRGRYMSEGTFANVRPLLTDAERARDRRATDESTDTYDTIDWLLRKIAYNNGRVGQWGISYAGFYAAQGAVSRHPALVASSPQAPVSDFFFEDFHHNGALTQGYFYAYPIFGIPTGGPRTDAWWAPAMIGEGDSDAYGFQLSLGPLQNTTARYYHDNLLWREIVSHPNYDEYWRARAVPPRLTGVRHAVLSVGGWFDTEDPRGALAVYEAIEKSSPAAHNTVVMGPFAHRGWAARGVERTVHGDIYFGDSLATKYQRDVEARFFRHWLKEPAGADRGLPDALMFDTGRKQWRDFARWPAANAIPRRLFFHADGSLSSDMPAEPRAFAEYVSDPRKPVPSSCPMPTISGDDMYQYMRDDQRCFASRPDVLVFTTGPLAADVTIGGEIMAHLFASTTGSDADYVVKVIDVYPADEPDSPFRPNANVHYAGYQQLVRAEIMRARFRKSFARPEPMVPNRVEEVAFSLPDVLHTFRKGHRIMVQVQSSWFPAFDRNPQTFVPSIYTATERDFVKATERISVGRAQPSYVEVQVLP